MDWKRAQVICIHEVFNIALVLVKTPILGQEESSLIKKLGDSGQRKQSPLQWVPDLGRD